MSYLYHIHVIMYSAFIRFAFFWVPKRWNESKQKSRLRKSFVQLLNPVELTSVSGCWLKDDWKFRDNAVQSIQEYLSNLYHIHVIMYSAFMRFAFFLVPKRWDKIKAKISAKKVLCSTFKLCWNNISEYMWMKRLLKIELRDNTVQCIHEYLSYLYHIPVIMDSAFIHFAFFWVSKRGDKIKAKIPSKKVLCSTFKPRCRWKPGD